MKIEQTLLSEMTDAEASDLRAMCVSVLHGGIVPRGAAEVMQEWIDAHGQGVPQPVGAFVQVALYSLLVRAEGKASSAFLTGYAKGYLSGFGFVEVPAAEAKAS